jgi:hypothetical protein
MSLTNEKLKNLRTDLKVYDGAIDEWARQCKITTQALNKFFKSVMVSERKLEVYAIGLKILKERRDREINSLAQIERVYSSAA